MATELKLTQQLVGITDGETEQESQIWSLLVASANRQPPPVQYASMAGISEGRRGPSQTDRRDRRGAEVMDRDRATTTGRNRGSMGSNLGRRAAQDSFYSLPFVFPFLRKSLVFFLKKMNINLMIHAT